MVHVAAKRETHIFIRVAWFTLAAVDVARRGRRRRRRWSTNRRNQKEREHHQPLEAVTAKTPGCCSFHNVHETADARGAPRRSELGKGRKTTALASRLPG